MKSLEAQYVELKEKIVAAEVAKGFSEAAVETTIKEAVKGETIEERLGRLQKHAKKVGITESGKKITRNNGSQSFTENDTKSRDERVIHFMGNQMTYTEACYLIGEQPEPGAKQPASITESIAARWKKYAPWLSNKDANTLAEMGKLP